MTPESKISKSFHIMYTDYSNIIGHKAIGMYYNIIWLNSTSLGKPVTLDYLNSKIKMEKDKIFYLIKKLGACGLVSRRRVESANNEDKDWEYVTSTPKYLSSQQKINVVNKLHKKVLINEEEKEKLLEYIRDIGDNSNKENDEDEDGLADVAVLTKDRDFSKPYKEPGPDTFLGLVMFYYRIMSKIFGGRYVSRNATMEAARLSDCMKSNEDTPEMTREFFKWILNRAKMKGQFEKVSSLGLYPEFRKHAYRALHVVRSGDKRFEEAPKEEISEDDKLVKNMLGVIEMYKGKGMEEKQIIDEVLTKNFGKDKVDKFLELRVAE